MKGLKSKKFRANDWARPSVFVEGNLTARDYKTLDPADENTNKNGYVLFIENEEGVHVVNPNSIELVD